MGWEAWLTVAVVLFCLGLLASNRYAPDVVMLGGLTLLLLAGVLTPGQALAGLANEGMITVAVLYVVVSGLRETGATGWFSTVLLGRPRSVAGAQMRLMAPVAGVSAFLNNTPVVAMFLPAVQDWARRHGIAVSYLMLPLSIAASAGGTCTLIGTSTTLVVNGQLIAQTDLPGMGMFELAWVGVPSLLATLAVVALLGRRLLPERRSMLSRLDDARQYTVEMLVPADSPLHGKSIEEAGLRRLPGMFLVEVDRDGQIIPAVGPQERLRSGDRLLFAGIVESVADLQRIRGLEPATDQVFKLSSPRHQRCLVEAVVSEGFPLLGRSVREGRFRTLYQAAIIAVARNGERIHRKIGDIVLRPGDTLLMEAHPSFLERYRNARDFLLVARLDNSTPPHHEHAWIALAILAGMVALVALGWLRMIESAMLAAGLMLITRCTSPHAARGAVDWQVLLVIAASLGLGSALDSTGAARTIAAALIDTAADAPWATLALVYLVTAAFTQVVTNNAAAVLMFPIALSAATHLGASPMPFAIVVAMAASASYLTPIGYQTNLMVQGPGGYGFGDYVRLGLPVLLVNGVIGILIVPLVWPFT